VLFALALTLAIARRATSEEEGVPVAVQASLLSKVAAYDRNLAARANGRVHVTIVAKPHDIASDRTAVAVQNALALMPTIAGLSHSEDRFDSADPAEIERTLRSRHPTIVYLAPGFEDGETRAIVRGMTGTDVLSVAGSPGYVPQGIVLGFDLVSGRPKLLVHLTQARRQNVDLTSEVLKLMKVYQ
jgi:hypothetical protein